MRRLLVLMVCVAANRAFAACPDELAAAEVTLDAEVEPAVCEALAAAVRRMPPGHRARLKKLRVSREADLGAPATAPLIYRMFSAGALAAYRVVPHQLVVMDAGARGEPRWTGGPASAADVKALTDALGIGWEELARRAGVTPAPAAGDAKVIDALVKLAVAKLLGGTVKLEELLAHELGHVVQLGRTDNSWAIEGFAALSGWRERERDEPADGYVGGFYANETPIVALRLALGLDRGPDALYAPRDGATFVTDYARFDPMEDFAEAYRFYLYDARRLEPTPDKWVAVAGYFAQQPPQVPPAVLEAGARRLLGYDGATPEVLYSLKVLKPYGAALEPLARRLGGKLPRWPDDVPAEIKSTLAELRVRAGKAWLFPEAAALLRAGADVVRMAQDMREFERVLPALADKPKPPSDAYDRLVAHDAEARRLLAAGDLAGAKKATAKLKGRSVGARMRAEMHARLCDAHTKKADSAAAAAARRDAQAARAQVFFPSWRADIPDCAP